MIVLDHLTETQKRAIIADNRLALSAGWDPEMLRVEVSALEKEDFNVNLLGFEEQTDALEQQMFAATDQWSA